MKSEEEFDKIYCNGIEVVDENNKIYKMNTNDDCNSRFFTFEENINRYNSVYILKINNLKLENEIRIKIREMFFINNIELVKTYENFELKLNI